MAVVLLGLASIVLIQIEVLHDGDQRGARIVVVGIVTCVPGRLAERACGCVWTVLRGWRHSRVVVEMRDMQVDAQPVLRSRRVGESVWRPRNVGTRNARLAWISATVAPVIASEARRLPALLQSP